MVVPFLNYLWSFSLLGKLALVVLALLLLLFSVVIYRAVIVPNSIFKHYEKQGVKIVKFEGSDPTKAWAKLAAEKGDCFFPWTDFVNKNPNEPAFVSHLGPFVSLQLVDPKLVKEFYTKEFDYYKKDHTFDTLEILFDDSLGLIPYNAWKARRRLYSQAFHFEFLKDNLPMVEEEAIKFCNRVNPSKNKSFLVNHELKYFTGLVAGQLFFGEDLSEVKVEGENIIHYLADLCDRLLTLFASFLLFIFGHRFVYMKILPQHRELFRRKAAFNEASKKLIQKKEEELKSGKSDQKNNLLSIFIKAKSDPETQLKDNSIVGEFMGFFFAGVDTTSGLLTSSFYYLCDNPHVAEKIREEISAHWSVGQPLTMDLINKFDYLNAFLKETLRMASIIFLTAGREAIKDHTIGDIKIKKGMLVAGAGRAMSYHPKYYKNPYVFDPERFLRKDAEELFNSDPYIFLPFSSGKRNCLGQHLAFLEAKTLLIHVVMKYKMEFPEGYQKGWNIDHGFYLPFTPLRPVLTPRS